jgi:hypothetical protein
MSRWVVLPELKHLFQDGFPLTASPDWKEAAVVLPEATPATVSAALDLIGLISQKIGVGPYGIRFVSDLQQAGNKHLLVLAPEKHLPAPLVQAARLDTVLTYPFPAQVAEKTWKQPSWWRKNLLKLFGRQSGREPELMNDLPPSSQVIAENALSGDSLFLSEFRSPIVDNRTAVLMAGKTGADVQKGVRELLDPGVSAKVQHDTALVGFHTDRPQVFTHQMQEPYSYGRQSPVPLFQDLILQSFWTFVLLCGAALVILALIVYFLLRGRKKKRLSHE